MKEIISRNLPFTHREVAKMEAFDIFKEQSYKLELLSELPDDIVSLYTQGTFTDLCRGPHVNSTGEIGAFKLTHTAGAYWKGDETRPMLQRIYGLAFSTEQQLQDYLDRQAEAAERDHKKLGKELDLYSIHEEIGPGLICWHPKGAMVRQIIEDFWRAEHIKRGYDIVFTPHIAKIDLWKTSGHWDFYQDSLYPPVELDEQQYIIKPMNCLGHIMIFKNHIRSYRELPIRYAELGTVYRYERTGALYGLARVRGFTQDDAHIFCRTDQIVDEVKGVVQLAQFMMHTFGFQSYDIMLSTRPDKYAGTISMWEQATDSLKTALDNLGLQYEIDEGEGVFYGPKIDIKLRDALGHAWQGPTIQVDFNLPERFNVCYIGNDSAEHNVTMIHRTVLGSMERFLACLIEHYKGAFPTWLAPVQLVVIPIADRHIEYARKVEDHFKNKGYRVYTDVRSERMNLKIRDAQLNKIPYMLIVGDKEMQSSMVSVRLRDGTDMGLQELNLVETNLQKDIKSRS
jgi:threonyl-tRNA synthetase